MRSAMRSTAELGDAATGREAGLGWLAIVRLGLVQTALGAIVVLLTSTLNRVMTVELALPAIVPGALVGLHYAVQITRPRWGYGSDVGGRRTPWIVGGMAALALGGLGAAVATAWAASAPVAGVVLAAAAFFLVGLGVGAAGTSLLTLLATSVAPRRRAAAASIVWIMMIAGFVVTAASAGAALDPYSHERLVAVCAAVSAIAFALACLAVAGVEKAAPARPQAAAPKERTPFLTALKEVWAEPKTRRFTVFVFVSMLAYSAQDLILEPFAGHAFGYTPGESTQLSGVQHGGVLAGMLVVAVIGSLTGGHRGAALRRWTIGGCIASAAALGGLALGGALATSGAAQAWPLAGCVFALGFANGVFAVAAIGSMMALATEGRGAREGVRMGLWGSAQAIAFGLGGFLGTALVDLARLAVGAPEAAYALVFSGEALAFLAAAVLASRVGGSASDGARLRPTLGAEPLPAELGGR